LLLDILAIAIYAVICGAGRPAIAAGLSALAVRGHWGIENCVHFG
jgi:hypothetical protein